MADVFISYPRKERARAETIKVKLEALGVSVFFDIQGIDGGAVFPKVITENLDAAKAVIACCSPLYFTRPWCLDEAHEGQARDVLVPLVLEKFERTAPPLNLRRLNFLNLTDWTGDDDHEDWRRTLAALEKLIGRRLLPSPSTKLGKRGGGEGAKPAPAISTAGDIPRHINLAHVILAKHIANGGLDFSTDDIALSRLYSAAKEALPDFEAGRTASIDLPFIAMRDGKPYNFKTKVVRGDFSEWSELGAPSPHPLPQESFGEREDQARRAAAAARAGRPVAERAFPIELPGVSGWPKPQMIAIPPGRFLMGAAKGEEGASDDEFPKHEVRIDYTFALGQHAVAFAEWDAAVAAGAKLEKPADQGWGRGNRPVINVSWQDAQAYLAWLNAKLGLTGRLDAYRLPSESEWEYACRAASKFDAPVTRWSHSDSEENLDDYAWFGENAGGKTGPIGQKKANGFGLFDMHGNVWEWCQDAWHSTYDEPDRPDDGSPWLGPESSDRVFRGGSWLNDPRDLRSAARNWHLPELGDEYFGFRLARTVST